MKFPKNINNLEKMIEFYINVFEKCGIIVNNYISKKCGSDHENFILFYITYNNNRHWTFVLLEN